MKPSASAWAISIGLSTAIGGCCLTNGGNPGTQLRVPDCDVYMPCVAGSSTTVARSGAAESGDATCGNVTMFDACERCLSATCEAPHALASASSASLGTTSSENSSKNKICFAG